mmetsp:Transcript_62149/g.110775  ORF Transcript_62149/g.110775 Transcript_62149/m.110775 type:complete len:112 (-) Transcript_62149:1013-1348(-)
MDTNNDATISTKTNIDKIKHGRTKKLTEKPRPNKMVQEWMMTANTDKQQTICHVSIALTAELSTARHRKQRGWLQVKVVRGHIAGQQSDSTYHQQALLRNLGILCTWGGMD